MDVSGPYFAGVETSLFDYVLPQELIAQYPLEQRDDSRLLGVDRKTRKVEHGQFRDLPAKLRKGDVLVLNDTRVIPARMHGVKLKTGGLVEVLLLEPAANAQWWAMVRPGKRVRPGTLVEFTGRTEGVGKIRAEVVEKDLHSRFRLNFGSEADVERLFSSCGEIPLPPYISRPVQQERDAERYQTVYGHRSGSVAAPTAGLHFTRKTLDTLTQAGVDVAWVTLHVGYGTFAPVKSADLAGHTMHAERYELPAATAAILRRAQSESRRVVAVGTTSVRVLESVAAKYGGALVADQGSTSLFIYPPFRFQVVDALVTNFHLPRSTLLMLVSAFMDPGGMEGRAFLLQVYNEAIARRYRFFSYGDAMWIA